MNLPEMYQGIPIYHLTISSLAGNKVSLKFYESKDDKKSISSLTFGNIFSKQFTKLAKGDLKLKIHINDDKMQTWQFEFVNKKFLLTVDDSYCSFLTQSQINDIVKFITPVKKSILGEAFIMSFDEFIGNKIAEPNVIDDEYPNELLFDINDEPINIDKYDSKNCWDYVDCYDDDDDFYDEIESNYGDDFWNEIQEMASVYSNHGLERIEERGIKKSQIEKILDSCRIKLLKLKDRMGQKILIRSKNEKVSIIGKLEKIGTEIKFKVITAIQGIGLAYDDSYNLIQI